MRKTPIAPLVAAALLAAITLTLAGCGKDDPGTPAGGTALVRPAASASPASVAATTAGSASSASTLADTVTATGIGKALSSPDLAEMTFGVSRRAGKAEDAMAEASSAGKRIAAALKREGIAAKDLQTASVSLYPRTDSNGRVTDYEASLNVRATVRDIAKLGSVIGAGTEAGANQVYGPTFTMADDNPARSKAIEAAVADARARAEVMAKAAGRKLGRIIAVTEGGASFPVYGGERAAAADAALSVPIEPGELETHTSLTVAFELL